MHLRQSLWEHLRRPASLRALAALPCALLAGGLLRLGGAPRQDRAQLWIDQGSVAAAEYRQFGERFPATELHVLRMQPGALRAGAAALTQRLRSAPGVLEVLSASELQPDWRDLSEHTLWYGCDSTGACYHIDHRQWAQARELHGPLSEQLRLLDLEGGAARVLVFARPDLDGSGSSLAPLIAWAHGWMKRYLSWLVPLLAASWVAVARRSWRLSLIAVGTATLAASASEAVLLALRQPASIAEPCAELAVFLLVLAAALEVLDVERTRSWQSGGENPWRAPSLGAGRYALPLGALALASASLALARVPALRALGAQSAVGLLLGAALVSTLLPTLAALLPRQPAPAPAPESRRRPGWQRAALLLAVAAVGVSVLATAGGFTSFGGKLLWGPFLGYAAVLFGLPLAFLLLRDGPALLQQRWPLQTHQPLPRQLQDTLDLYVASHAVAYALALPIFLTAAPGSAERLDPEPFGRASASEEPHAAEQRLTRVELSLTTPEAQLTRAGLARLEQLARQLEKEWPALGVIEPGLLLREAAYQLGRSSELPHGPWLDDARVAGRLFEHYVADQGRTTRLSLLLEPPAGVSPVVFAARLPLEAIARRVHAALPDAELTITGPDRLVAEAAVDPLRLPAFLLLALVLASAFPRLIGREGSRARDAR